MKKVIAILVIITLFLSISFLSQRNKCRDILNKNINTYVTSKKVDLLSAENTLRECLIKKELKEKSINFLVDSLYYDKQTGKFDFKN